MAVVASSIISRVRTQLIDEGTEKRWTDTELLRWLSDGQRAVVDLIPQASSRVYTHPLIAGPRQIISEPARAVLGINFNIVGVTGFGRAISRVTRELLDRQYPTWPSEVATAIARHYFVDESDPRVFYVYPPNDGTGQVQVVASNAPEELTALTDNIGVRDLFATPLFDYVMYRAHLKDSDYAAGQGLAQVYYGSFMTFLTSYAEQAKR